MVTEFTPNCRCKIGEIKLYLDYTNTVEGQLVVDHEPPLRAEDNNEKREWAGGVCIARLWKTPKGEREDFVILNRTEAEKVRDALNAFLWDHQ